MLIINSYQHNTRDGDFTTGIIDRKKDITVEQTDILVVHRDYGICLFEVKDMIKRTNGISETKNNELCPMSMIDKSVRQLNTRWVQIKEYLRNFFEDETIRNEWQQYWDVDDLYFDKVRGEVTCNDLKAEEIKKKSFICLIGQRTYDTDNNGNRMFNCHLEDNICKCPKKDPICVKCCNVLTHDELKDFESFNQWWKTYFNHSSFKNMKSRDRKQTLPAFAFLLNRYFTIIKVKFYKYETSI